MDSRHISLAWLANMSRHGLSRFGTNFKIVGYNISKRAQMHRAPRGDERSRILSISLYIQYRDSLICIHSGGTTWGATQTPSRSTVKSSITPGSPGDLLAGSPGARYATTAAHTVVRVGGHV